MPITDLMEMVCQRWDAIDASTLWEQAMVETNDMMELRALAHEMAIDMRWVVDCARVAMVRGIVAQAVVFGADRIALFAARRPRGGGWFEGCWEVSALTRWFPGGRFDPLAYQRLEVDGGYMRMMRRVDRTGSQIYRPEELESPLLCGIYRREAVRNSVVVGLGEHKDWYLYFSAARYAGEFTLPERVGIESLGAAARGALQSSL